MVEGVDPLKDGFFNEADPIANERVQVKINDIVVCDWIGPPGYMDADIHHFYNYNSWEDVAGPIYDYTRKL